MARQSNWKIKLNDVCLTVSKLEIPNFEKIEEKKSFVSKVDTITQDLNNILLELDKKIRRTKYCDPELAAQDTLNYDFDTVISHNPTTHQTTKSFETVHVDKTNGIKHTPIANHKTNTTDNVVIEKTEQMKYAEIRDDLPGINSSIKNNNSAVIVHDKIKHTIVSHEVKLTAELIKKFNNYRQLKVKPSEIEKQLQHEYTAFLAGKYKQK